MSSVSIEARADLMPKGYWLQNSSICQINTQLGEQQENRAGGRTGVREEGTEGKV